MLTYYSPIKPYQTHQLDVDTMHQIYIEESGNPKGLPVLVVHSGPGCGSQPKQRRYFDPNQYRIILFDQRGCGQSKPRAQIKGNNTQKLISDMEKIREVLHIKRWLLFGGSWGATLCLAYAQAHPKRVLGLVLWAVLLGRSQDIAWLLQHGANQVYPEQWAAFIASAHVQNNDIINAYYNTLTGSDDVASMAAAKAWSNWLGHCATFSHNNKAAHTYNDTHCLLTFARLSCYYFKHQYFFKDNQLLNNAQRLNTIPGILIHGRYDMVSPIENAWSLHQAWPQTDMVIIPEAGHCENQPAMVHALIHAAKTMARHHA